MLFCVQNIINMPNKKIYLIRHGQTNFNLKGIVQGSGVDADLNDTGRMQAEAFFEMYQDIPFDKVYTSTLKRTVQSVQNFIDKGIPVEHLSGLNEISWGSKEGRMITPQEDQYYHYVLESWKKGEVELAIEGGESPLQVLERQKPVIDYIMSQDNEQHVLICMHGRAMRILLTYLLNYELKEMDQFEHNNLCLYQITFTGSMFVVDKYNDLSHLNSKVFSI
jgi:broad specificity phosphatase PhoE